MLYRSLGAERSFSTESSTAGKVTADKKVPQYLQIAEELRNAICDGVYPAGVRLPPELSLAEQYGVARMTVREGLKLLQDEGLIVRKQGSGTVVQRGYTPKTTLTQSFSQLEDLLQYSLRTRIAFEPGKKVRLPPSIAAKTQHGIGKSWLCFRGTFHNSQDPCPIAITHVYVSPALREYFGLIEHENSLIIKQLEKFSGKKVATITQDICSRLIEPETADRLMIDEGQPILRVIRTYDDESGQSLQISVTDHPADFFTFTSKMSIAQT